MYILDPNYMYLLTTIANLRRELEEDRLVRHTAAAPAKLRRSRRRQARLSPVPHRSPDLTAPSR